MHVTDPPQASRRAFPAPSPTRSRAGFSLVEVSLAIGIIAVAFVALFGLLPTGLTTFRAAIDDGNSGRIMEGLTSRAQATEFGKVLSTFDYVQSSGIVYYFDEEGSFIRAGKSNFGDLNDLEKARALYAAKIFGNTGWSGYTSSTNSVALTVLLATVNSPAHVQLESFATATLFTNKLNEGTLDRGLRVRSMVIAKMDGVATQ